MDPKCLQLSASRSSVEPTPRPGPDKFALKGLEWGFSRRDSSRRLSATDPWLRLAESSRTGRLKRPATAA
ncbi:protein of unknown function [Methylocella tundrae]|uniref:Uncharacterized protein n=1 Tax=Methylocella tundrae TaxID=227605 RepID=A0A4U8Z3U8_METTU|nr:protein of unknown function [Methylocella tundrae]